MAELTHIQRLREAIIERYRVPPEVVDGLIHEVRRSEVSAAARLINHKIDDYEVERHRDLALEARPEERCPEKILDLPLHAILR